jgi:hypothetical protein
MLCYEFIAGVNKKILYLIEIVAVVKGEREKVLSLLLLLYCCCMFLILSLANHGAECIGKEQAAGNILFARTRSGKNLPKAQRFITGTRHDR